MRRETASDKERRRTSKGRLLLLLLLLLLPVVVVVVVVVRRLAAGGCGGGRRGWIGWVAAGLVCTEAGWLAAGWRCCASSTARHGRLLICTGARATVVGGATCGSGGGEGEDGAALGGWSLSVLLNSQALPPGVAHVAVDRSIGKDVCVPLSGRRGVRAGTRKRGDVRPA